jgi:hypothetical protein
MGSDVAALEINALDPATHYPAVVDALDMGSNGGYLRIDGSNVYGTMRQCPNLAVHNSGRYGATTNITVTDI